LGARPVYLAGDGDPAGVESLHRVARRGPEGFNLRPFRSAGGVWWTSRIAIMFALASFVGFEATAIYGEESRNPTRTVPMATYAAVSIIMVFFAFTTWAIISSYGADRVVAAAFCGPGEFLVCQE